MDKNEIENLIRAFKNGDSQAFNKLVLMFQARIYNLALNYVKSEEEAKDLTQDIFVSAFRAIKQLREESKFSSWLFQIAVNHCRNRYKKLQRRGYFNSLSIDDPDNAIQLQSNNSPEESLEKSNLIRKMKDVIATMPKAEKEIIILRDLQDFTYDEISQILDIPIGTVKSKLNRARTSLKNKLKKHLN